MNMYIFYKYFYIMRFFKNKLYISTNNATYLNTYLMTKGPDFNIYKYYVKITTTVRLYIHM